MRELDPRIHDEAQIQNSCGSDRLRCLMDCRGTPAHDVERIAAPTLILDVFDDRRDCSDRIVDAGILVCDACLFKASQQFSAFL